MPRKLLVGSQTGVWREWLKANRGDCDLICLDPADAEHGFSARAALYREGKCVAWRFVGSLSASRSPHVMVAALASLLPQVRADSVVELFPFRPSPLLLQLARICSELIRPESILVDQRAHLEKSGWSASPEEVALPEAPPAGVLFGQRKARWLQLLEQCEAHEVDLRHVALEGTRLGSGVPVPLENLRKFGFSAPMHGEVAGSSLLVVTDAVVEDVEVSRALDSVHASTAHIVSSKSYENLICAFAREDGEDFGMGRVERIDFPSMVAHVQCSAVAPAPVRVLRIGGLRLNAEGKELGEARAWEV